MTDVRRNLEQVRSSLAEGVKLVAVSKYHPEHELMQAYEAGQRVFGESHEQELRRKVDQLPGDIEWHFIGHLQTNKVKLIVPYIAMIESVDSIRLLREIERQAERQGRAEVRVLLELHLAEEETKYGLSPDDCRRLLADGEWRKMEHVRICGLMMMASNTDDEARIVEEFETASRFFDEVKKTYFSDDDAFCERSWGMSDDYHLAMRHGSTMVRIGTTIFGPRVY